MSTDSGGVPRRPFSSPWLKLELYIPPHDIHFETFVFIPPHDCSMESPLKCPPQQISQRWNFSRNENTFSTFTRSFKLEIHRRYQIRFLAFLILLPTFPRKVRGIICSTWYFDHWEFSMLLSCTTPESPCLWLYFERQGYAQPKKRLTLREIQTISRNKVYQQVMSQLRLSKNQGTVISLEHKISTNW